MSLIIKLSLDKRNLVVETAHGLEIGVTADAAGMEQLHRMLLAQDGHRKAKLASKVDPATLTHSYILAEYERAPDGNGKVLKKRYDTKGRLVEHNGDLPIL